MRTKIKRRKTGLTRHQFEQLVGGVWKRQPLGSLRTNGRAETWIDYSKEVQEAKAKFFKSGDGEVMEAPSWQELADKVGLVTN